MKYRPHRGLLYDSMREVVEVNDLPQLVRHMRRSVESWYPPDELPTIENTEVKPYMFDDRIGWNTHIVLVKGSAWGFTDGPCQGEEMMPYDEAAELRADNERLRKLLAMPEIEELRVRIEALEEVVKAIALAEPITVDDNGRLRAMKAITLTRQTIT